MSSIRFSSFPRTEPFPHFLNEVMTVFRENEHAISTVDREKGLKSDAVLAQIRDGLVKIGFDAEEGKRADQKIKRPVFFGENGVPTVQYEIDAYHPEWQCGLEIEAGRAWMGNAVYRDLVQASIMVQVRYLLLAVPNMYKYNSGGRPTASHDYDNMISLADALYGHSRLRLPYDLVVIGY